MRVVPTEKARPPVTIEFTYEEVKKLEGAVAGDLVWSETDHEDLWRLFHSVLRKGIDSAKF